MNALAIDPSSVQQVRLGRPRLLGPRNLVRKDLRMAPRQAGMGRRPRGAPSSVDRDGS